MEGVNGFYVLFHLELHFASNALHIASRSAIQYFDFESLLPSWNYIRILTGPESIYIIASSSWQPLNSSSTIKSPPPPLNNVIICPLETITADSCVKVIANPYTGFPPLLLRRSLLAIFDHLLTSPGLVMISFPLGIYSKYKRHR